MTVTSALYGSPTSHDMQRIHAYDGSARHCAKWVPEEDDHDVAVDLAARQIASRTCDGTAQCEIDVSGATRHLRDPCPGLIKIMRVTIKCRTAAPGQAFGRKQGAAASLIDEAKIRRTRGRAQPLKVGVEAPPNPWADKLDTLLKFWDTAAAGGGIAYSITYGTYLGWVRNRDYIPYDGDVDVHIGSDGVPLLMALANRAWCCTPQELAQHPIRFGEPRLQ